MTVTIGSTYTTVEISADMTDIWLPATVRGSVKPGSFDHIKNLRHISWGIGMTGLIEPKTIPAKPISLFLPESYKHQLELSEIPTEVDIYIHVDQIDQVPADREFIAWSANKIDVEGHHPKLKFELSTADSFGAATAIMGTPCWCNGAKYKSVEPVVEEPALPAPNSIDANTFEQMVAQSKADDPRFVQAERVAVMIGMELYANIQAALAACTLHNEFNAVYKIGELGARDTYRDMILTCLRTAFPSLTFAIMPDMCDRVFVTYNC